MGIYRKIHTTVKILVQCSAGGEEVYKMAVRF